MKKKPALAKSKENTRYWGRLGREVAEERAQKECRTKKGEKGKTKFWRIGRSGQGGLRERN